MNPRSARGMWVKGPMTYRDICEWVGCNTSTAEDSSFSAGGLLLQSANHLLPTPIGKTRLIDQRTDVVQDQEHTSHILQPRFSLQLEFSADEQLICSPSRQQVS